MKILKYNLCDLVNRGTDENPMLVEVLSPVEMGWNEVNEEIAKREAYKGKYTIEEVEDPEPAPSDEDSAVWDELDAAYQEGVDSV